MGGVSMECPCTCHLNNELPRPMRKLMLCDGKLKATRSIANVCVASGNLCCPTEFDSSRSCSDEKLELATPPVLLLVMCNLHPLLR
mmetsp:Transcript_19826/g.35272  ORF Transcript_19826/g.35272 Transcript_19826/m.35272 type:complete len:86 (+) Transcript_19826:601-858(+)